MAVLHVLIFGLFLGLLFFVFVLLRKIRRQAEDLKSTNLQLVESLEGLRDADPSHHGFFSMISHELRTPLTVIIGFSQVLANNMERCPPSMIKRYLAIIDSDAHRLLRLIEGLLDLSRIERQGLTLHPVAFDLDALYGRLIEEFKASRPGRDIHFESDPHLPHVYGDMDRLYQIGANLIDNAIKYSPAESVIRLKISRQGENVRIQVSDSGLAIPDHMKANAFNPFFHTPEAVDKKLPSTGLELAVVKAIVHGMGGTIFVEDAAPSGSQFTCVLPFRMPRAA